MRPFTGARHMAPIAAVTVRPVTEEDVDGLANLCTDALYFEADLKSDGLVVCLQRQMILQQQRRNLARRIKFEGASECRFFVAEDSGRICGCLDMAVHLFDNNASQFELTASAMPEGGDQLYRWCPYVASLAVSRVDRRSGIGRRLIQNAERWAWRSGYREVMLEVAQTNDGALSFYKQKGYTVLSTFDSGEAGGGAIDLRRAAWWWDIRDVGKFVMRKKLSGLRL